MSRIDKFMERVDSWVPRVEPGGRGKFLLMGTEFLCRVGGGGGGVMKLF